MKLSILICTIPSRHEMFYKLLNQVKLLCSKHSDGILEILIQADTHLNIGQKRNKLLEEAKGDFVVFIDDDDEIHDDYVDCMLNAIEICPDADCIGYKGYITFNGSTRKNWVISKECLTWHEKDQVYYRTPNHISPVRREIALSVKFPEITFGEDYEYSMGILPMLKKETFVDKELYHYKFMAK
jgi:glycosyltransferase involved in cell wall biosynthesis